MRTFLLLCIFLPATAVAGRGASYGRIVAAIQSGNADVISVELERAERLVCARCVDPVLGLLGHPDHRVREAAAWWFARRPLLKATVTRDSLSQLAAAEARAAGNAADVLGSLRAVDAIPALTTALSRPESPVRLAAVRALGDIADPRGERAILLALLDGAPEVRAAAVAAYAALRGSRDGEPLQVLLGDGDAAVRREAAAVLGNLRAAGARARLETLLRTDSDALVRRNAAWALGNIGDTASRQALEVAAASDPVAYVRSVARASLVALSSG